MLYLRGGKISTAEDIVFSQTLQLLELLKIGIPYNTVMQLDDDEVSRILGVHYAIKQKQQEDQEAANRA